MPRPLRALAVGLAAARGALFGDPVVDQETTGGASGTRTRPPRYLDGGSHIQDAKTGNRSYLSTMDIQPFNPDDLVRFKREGLRIYQRMLKEVFIKVPWMLKMAQALSNGHGITPASDDPIHIEQAEWVRWNFKQISGGLKQKLREAGGGALLHGFSLGEKIPYIVEGGDWSGMIGWKGIRDLDPNAFEFVVDQYRNVLGVSYADAPNTGAPEFDIDQFLHVVWMQMHCDPHGTSDLRASHRAAWLYDTISKLRARYVEKFAIPWVVGTTKRSKLFKQEEDAFWAAVKSLQEDASILLYDGQTVEIKSAVTDQSAFETMQGRLQMEMLVNSMGSHLAITEGVLQGAKAQGEVHESTSAAMVQMVRDVLEQAVTEQLIRPIICWNYEDDGELPIFSLAGEASATIEDAQLEKQQMENDDTFMRMGGKISIPQLHQKYNRPVPEDDEELATPTSSGGGGLFGAPSPFGGPPPGFPPGRPGPIGPKKGGQPDAPDGDEQQDDEEDAGHMMSMSEAAAFADEIGAGLPKAMRRQIAQRLINEDRAYWIGADAWAKRVARYRFELKSTLEKKSPTAL